MDRCDVRRGCPPVRSGHLVPDIVVVGQNAYVAAAGGDSVFAVNATSGTSVGTLTVGQRASMLSVDATVSVVVGCRGIDASVSLIDTQHGTTRLLYTSNEYLGDLAAGDGTYYLGLTGVTHVIALRSG